MVSSSKFRLVELFKVNPSARIHWPHFCGIKFLACWTLPLEFAAWYTRILSANGNQFKALWHLDRNIVATYSLLRAKNSSCLNPLLVSVSLPPPHSLSPCKTPPKFFSLRYNVDSKCDNFPDKSLNRFSDQHRKTTLKIHLAALFLAGKTLRKFAGGGSTINLTNGFYNRKISAHIIF